MTLSLSPAAVCQCFTLVALSTSIADPNWITIENSTDSSKQLIYGVAFTLHDARNLTDTGPLGGMNGAGMWLLYALAAGCFSAVLFSSSSFLLDFLGVGLTRLVTSLHVSTAVLCLAILGVAGACLYVIQQNVQKGKLGWFWDSSAQADGLRTLPGESFYIHILAFLFSCGASFFSLRNSSEPNELSHYISAEHEDGEREPLLGGMEPNREKRVKRNKPNTAQSLHI